MGSLSESTDIPRTGDLRKMHVKMANPIEYTLPIGEERVPLNRLIGTTVTIRFAGIIHCIFCGRRIKKTYNQGYCYPCFGRLARCDLCIVKPELCHFHKGTCREEEWGRSNCMQDHVVYLANSSGPKVGITRSTNIPTRWIDQGAIQALPIMRVSTRFQSGLIENALRTHINDRTNWRVMLKGIPKSVDLPSERTRLLEKARDDLEPIKDRFPDQKMDILADEELVHLDLPVMEYPDKISSINLETNPTVSGKLMGIKGQYLLLDTGVINIRKYAGYSIQWGCSS